MLIPGQQYDIAQVLPHGPGFVLLDRLLGYDADSTRCEVTIRRGSRFCEDARGVPGWVGIEYLAQAIGAYVGIRRLQRGQPVQICMLLGTRSYECELPRFAPGMRLQATARELLRAADGVGAYACELSLDGRVVARAEIKGFDPEDVEPFLKELQATAP